MLSVKKITINVFLATNVFFVHVQSALLVHGSCPVSVFHVIYLYIPPCPYVPVCAWTKEAVNLTMSAGRTSGCPVVHLGKRPTSNNTSLLILVEVLWFCLQQQRPDASTSSWMCRETHEKCGFPITQKQPFSKAVTVLFPQIAWIWYNFVKNFPSLCLIVQYLSGYLALQTGTHLNDAWSAMQPSLLCRNSWLAVASVQRRGGGLRVIEAHSL